MFYITPYSRNRSTAILLCEALAAFTAPLRREKVWDREIVEKKGKSLSEARSAFKAKIHRHKKSLKIYNLATGGTRGRSAMLSSFPFKATPEASRAFEVPESGNGAGGSIPRLRERHPGSSTVMFGAMPRPIFLDVRAGGAKHL